MSEAGTDARGALMASIGDALGALADERRAFLEGTYRLVPKITERKSRLLAVLEQGVGRVQPDAELKAALESVIAESRRNEQIIAAALQGLRSARRRIKAIIEASGGTVAYAADGTRIASSADLAAHSKSA